MSLSVLVSSKLMDAAEHQPGNSICDDVVRGCGVSECLALAPPSSGHSLHLPHTCQGEGSS